MDTISHYLFSHEEEQQFEAFAVGYESFRDVDIHHFIKFLAYCLRTSRGCVAILNGASCLIHLIRSRSIVTTEAKQCGAIITAACKCYKCIDCGADNNCVMCQQCFMASPCVNHRFKTVTNLVGTCDCGDAEAWKPQSFCRFHQASASVAIQEPNLMMQYVCRAVLFLALGAHFKNDRDLTSALD